MKTVQLTLDENLVKSVDRAAKKMRTSRSGFTRQALRAALQKLEIVEMEEKHRRGYKHRSVETNEFSIWDKEQVWTE